MDFPSNSHNIGEPKKLKEDPPKKDVQKVVEGTVIQKPKSIGRRFKEIFFGGEAKNASRYVVGDVLLPAFKNMIVDATSKGVERMIYGDTGPRRRSGGMMDYGRPRVSYNQPVDRYARRSAMLPDQPPHRQSASRRREANEIILVSREEAELVLERLIDIIDVYDVASVADLHDLVGLPATYVDNKWGWKALGDSEVRQIREGYLLDLPPVEDIS